MDLPKDFGSFVDGHVTRGFHGADDFGTGLLEAHPLSAQTSGLARPEAIQAFVRFGRCGSQARGYQVNPSLVVIIFRGQIGCFVFSESDAHYVIGWSDNFEWLMIKLGELVNQLDC